MSARRSSPTIRTLQRAADTLGGVPRLARAFNVSPEEVHAWLSGAKTPPADVYMMALDVVARGPLAKIRSSPTRI